jgi:RNA polymerase sigma-70 factor (ECF subfamily)
MYELHEMIPDTSIPTPDVALEREDRETAMKAVIDSLAPKHRTVLAMRIYEELDYSEIARRLNCPIGTVKSRIHYALKALKVKTKGLSCQ